jgi:sec-independent protein translocase protein TatA
MGNIGAPELIIILLVVLVLFGASRLPKLARSIGEASREFKKGVSEVEASERPPTLPNPAGEPKPPEERVTMTRAELDAMLAEREARARRDAPPTD